VNRLGILLFFLFQSQSFAFSQHSLSCVDERSDSIVQVILDSSGEELLFSFEQKSEVIFATQINISSILNDEPELFRLYYKSFGFWNWKSVDLRFYPQFQILRLTYRYKDTSWSGDSDIGGQTIDFTDCENNIPFKAY
jgi:hypothetical protein